VRTVLPPCAEGAFFSREPFTDAPSDERANRERQHDQLKQATIRATLW
jgi:hypothetical protein